MIANNPNLVFCDESKGNDTFCFLSFAVDHLRSLRV